MQYTPNLKKVWHYIFALACLVKTPFDLYSAKYTSLKIRRRELKDLFVLLAFKAPPPPKSCETINSSREEEATISRQQSQFHLIQGQAEQSTASQAVENNITEPFQPADFN